jgi:hypothetical protein
VPKDFVKMIWFIVDVPMVFCIIGLLFMFLSGVIYIGGMYSYWVWMAAVAVGGGMVASYDDCVWVWSVSGCMTKSIASTKLHPSRDACTVKSLAVCKKSFRLGGFGSKHICIMPAILTSPSFWN